MSTTANNPCRTCARCCRWYMVGVSGYDVWRISSRQRLDPEQFLIVHRNSDRGLDTFQLERGGGPLAIGLDKRGQAETEHTQPCVFLMTLRDGHERCGIYADRPDACRTYPSGVVRNIMAQRDCVQCPPGSWPADTWEQPRWLLSQQRQDMNADVYAEVVARWNARVAGEPVGTQFTLHGYLEYVMNVYDALSKLDASLGEEALAEVEASWRELAQAEREGAKIPVRRGEYPWLDYFVLSRQIIDGFYPRLEPQPIACSWGVLVEFEPDDV